MTLSSPAGMLALAALVTAVLIIGWLLRMLDTRIGRVAKTAEDEDSPTGQATPVASRPSSSDSSAHPPRSHHGR
jgi:hypothetical protein